MKKIPYGESDYQSLIEQQYWYVDKTKYLEILESYGEKFIFFLRPRRFGKTLLISMLDAYYDVARQANFEQLFGETHIGKNITPLHNSYYILRFNFSGIDTSTKEGVLQGFTNKMHSGFVSFEKRYGFDLHYRTSGMPAEIFSAFLAEIQYAIAQKIYVLIDEYDHFANELLSFQVEVFEEVISKTGFVRKWYEVLKEGTERGVVDRIFATGVSPITLDSLTSGFNIAFNHTRDRNLNAMLGFTEDEVREIMRQTIPALTAEQIEQIMPELRKYYNGYLFSEDAHIRVFNSDMALYYLTLYHKYLEPPKDLIDTNISSDYAKLRSLFTLKNRERNAEILQELLSGETPKTMLTREFSLAKRFTRQDFLSLLFYLGFLTIKSGGRGLRVVLDVPNYVIRELYFDFFEEILSQQVALELDEIIEGIEEIAFDGKIARFVKCVETTLQQFSFRDFEQFDAKYVKLVMLTYLMISKIYYVKSEYEVAGGYIDIVLLPRSGVQVDYEAIIEVKYLKQKDYDAAQGEKKLQEIVGKAKTQLANYCRAQELRERRALKKWVVVFSGKRCIHAEEAETTDPVKSDAAAVP